MFKEIIPKDHRPVNIFSVILSNSGWHFPSDMVYLCQSMPEGDTMTPISETVLKHWQVRKTADQKTAFIQFLQGQFPELRVEADKKSRNLVLGDLSSARVVLTAHYDTCARLPFPNFITPLNFPVYLGYQLLITAPFIALLLLIRGLVLHLTHSELLGFWIGYAAMMSSMFYLLMGGPANPYTANDNTSGVITLLELYQAMTPQQRSRVALVFFDNEENGLLGSKAFYKAHKQEAWKEKLLLNFDCVSDGDTFLFVLNKPGMNNYGDTLRAAFPASQAKQVLMESTAKAFYPSDQANFPVSCAVAALNQHKLWGLYMDKIHTPEDRCFDTRNIEFLTAGTLRFLDSLPE